MKNILVIFGGSSAEHEVSVRSARNVIAALDKSQYRAINVGITRSGTWYLLKFDDVPENFTEVTDNLPEESICSLIRTPKETIIRTFEGKSIKIDTAFPLVHGPMGEDGTLQGLFEMMKIPYVGPGVLCSAIGMDKDIAKKLLIGAGIDVVPSITLIDAKKAPTYKEICEKLDSNILFIKPSAMGSSVGVSKIKSNSEYLEAIKGAFKYSFKVMVEKYVAGREIECSVLGNINPKASRVGELKPCHEFYSYEAKYLDPNGAEYIIPAKDLDIQLENKIRQTAVDAFKAIEGRGMARVDFFVAKEDNKIYVNELNTIPGFTSISMYPKMWEASGLKYSDLITQLITFAEEEFALKIALNTKPDL
jgi:D-alanine-D-alanine ligase